MSAEVLRGVGVEVVGMPEPIVFISHFRIKEGRLDALKQLTHRVTADMKAEKPRTLVYLSYVDNDEDLLRLTDSGKRRDYVVKGSPDGTAILFFRPHAPDETSDSVAQDLFVASSDGEAVTQLSSPGMTSGVVYSYDSVSWSPDGSQVAVVLAQGDFWTNSSRSVYTVEVGGSGVKPIGPRGDIWDAVWSPDGSWIAFTMATPESNGLHQLFLMRPDGSDVRPLVTAADGQWTLQPVWSPDSAQLLALRGAARLASAAPDVSAATLWLVNADGSGLDEMATSPAGYVGVAWLPGL